MVKQNKAWHYGPLEKFKYWLAEINYNAASDAYARNPTDQMRERRDNLRRYLEHKSPFGK